MNKPKSILITFSAALLVLAGCTKDNANKVPVANAGPSKVVIVPTDTVTLTGTGTDADGQVLAYLWSEISGPNSAAIAYPGSPSTLVKGLVQGTYVFQLMVTDNEGATGVDTATVVVSPSNTKILTLQPGNNPNEYSLEVVNGVDQSGPSVEIVATQWTSSGNPLTFRELMKYDLSSIPANATITSASLYLYSDPTPLNGDFISANSGANNSMMLQQVTSAWSPSTTKWTSQPTVTATNQVSIPSTTDAFLDLNIDVTAMVASQVSTGVNYGFALKLQSEVAYTARIFVSSYSTTYPAKHPKLVVTYH